MRGSQDLDELHQHTNVPSDGRLRPDSTGAAQGSTARHMGATSNAAGEGSVVGNRNLVISYPGSRLEAIHHRPQ